MNRTWSERAVTALAYVTGASGPLRRLFDRLRGIGVGERVIKSALAAMLAYWLARFLPDNENPVLAPLTAVFSINLTIAGGMRDAWQRILGVVLGIAVALLANWLLGPGSVAIGIVVLISFYAGRRLGLEASGVQQLAVSALLVALGAAGAQVGSVAALHFANILIGTGIGLLLNASVAPPNYVTGARAEVLGLGSTIRSILLDLSEALQAGLTHEQAQGALLRARAVATSLHDADTALSRADESLHYNLFGRPQQATLARYRRADQVMEHAAIQTRIVARSLSDATALQPAGNAHPAWLAPDDLGIPLAQLLNEAAQAMSVFLRALDHQVSDAEPFDMTAFRQRKGEVQRAALDHIDALLPDGWELVGEMISVTAQMVTDLAAAIDAETVTRPPDGES